MRLIQNRALAPFLPALAGCSMEGIQRLAFDQGRQWVALALLCTSIAVSAGYPSPEENYVNDFARRLDDATKQHLRDTLSALEQETGVEMSVAVIQSVMDYGTGDSGIEPFATGLFNAWGVGDRDRNDGILLLVALGDREVRIELGSGYARGADAVAQKIINTALLPHFRREDYAGGIRAGADALVSRSRAGALPVLSGLASLGDRFLGEVEEIGAWPAAGAGGAILALLYGGWRVLSRRRPRNCPRCRTRMQLLDEMLDDRFLDAGERLEENLDSVDYDVWQCPSCKTTEKVPYRAWFSSWKRCPECCKRTLKETTHVLQAATYSAEGRRRIRGECRHCHHHNERTEAIPRKQKSSSGSSGRSGSSFGGGRSSGRGASGRW